jgi:hypothetical protein
MFVDNVIKIAIVRHETHRDDKTFYKRTHKVLAAADRNPGLLSPG